MKRIRLIPTLQSLLIIAGIFFSYQIHAQVRKITGSIKDETGKVLSGATITIKGTNKAVATTTDGSFTIEVNTSVKTLLVSHIGMVPQEVPVTSSDILYIILKPQATTMSDVVVIGYGTVKKSDLTGSVATIKRDELLKTNPVSIEQGIQGKVTGVQVMQNDGAPGAGISMQIRGANSFLGGTEPLYVIDGIPFTGSNSSSTPGSLTANEIQTQNVMSFINPQDIESIEILKDASATAIYGSRGANGVVLITTKRGKKGDDKIEVSVVESIASVAKTLKMLDAETYARYQNEAYINADIYAGTNYQESGQLPYSGSIDPITGQYKPKPEEFRGKSTDWQKEIFRNALTQSYNVTLSGGGDKGTHAISFDYLDQQGIIVNSAYKRASARVNLTRNVKKWLIVGSNTSIARSTNNMLNTGSTNLFGTPGVIRSALTYPPVYGTPVSSDAQLKMQRTTDPYTYTHDVQDNIISNNIFSSNYLEVSFTPDLKFKQNIGFNYSGNLRNQYYPVSTYEGAADHGKAGESNNTTTSFVSESILTYLKKIKEHSINAMLGTTYENSIYIYESMSANNFPNDMLTSFNLSAGTVYGTPVNGRQPRKLLSYLGRVNYSYNDKYLLTASYRMDGSSVFGPENRWAGFPSFSAAWKINKEDFVGRLNKLNDLKLRVGYGITGNQAISPYAALSQYWPVPYISSETQHNGYAVTTLGNNKLKWETTAQFNIGLDVALPKNIASFTIDWYNKKTTNLLQNIILPGNTGYYSQLQNVGSIQNRGWEFGVNANIFNKETFKWNTAFNITTNRNKILSLGDKDQQFADKITLTDAPFIQKVGQPVGMLYGYVEDGFYNSEADVRKDPLYMDADETKVKSMVGEIRYKDLDGKTGITDADRTYIGNVNPKYSFGFTNNFTYKKFDFSIFIMGVQGNDIINLTKYYMSNLGYLQYGNITQDLYNGRWTAENPTSAVNPKAIATTTRSFYFTRRFIEDGSFVRLKNITVGYNIQLPKLQFINSLRVYVAANNLLTITNYSGYDPEVNGYGQNPAMRGVDLGGYPVSRTFAMGIKCAF